MPVGDAWIKVKEVREDIRLRGHRIISSRGTEAFMIPA